MLGAILLEGRAAMDLVMASPLRVTDFYTEHRRQIFGAMRTLYLADRPVDLITTAEMLRASGQLGPVGGPAALALLVEQGSIAAYLSSYIDIVTNTAKRRELIQTGAQLVQEATEGEHAADQIIGGAVAGLEGLTRRASMTAYDPAVNWEHVVTGWGRGAIWLGLEPLDALVKFGRGDLLVVGGRTSHGKTAWTIDRSLALARRGVTVEILTLEESQDAATRRLTGNLSGVSIYKLRDGALSAREFQAAEEAVMQLQQLPVTVRGLESLRAPDEQTVLGAVSLSKAEVVIIDHGQKVWLRTQKGEHYTYAVRRLADRLHTIALRDGKVVWVNCQLSRETEHRKGPPMLSDLVDSASWENAARHVHLLFWPWHQDQEKDPTEDLVYVAKQSEGGTGKVGVRFYASSGRFEAPERERP